MTENQTDPERSNRGQPASDELPGKRDPLPWLICNLRQKQHARADEAPRSGDPRNDGHPA